MSEKVDAYKVVTDRIIELLEQGTIPWNRPWKSYGVPMNLMSMKPYRGVNAFMTAIAGFGSPYFLTYKQASELGANIRKGERGIPVVFWAKAKGKEEADSQDEARGYSFIRYYTIFNIEQVEGLPEKLYKKLTDKPVLEFVPLEKCEEIIERSMLQLPIKVGSSDRAYYSPSLDYINMPAKEGFKGIEEYYSVLFHEMTHATGHEARLNRKSLTEAAYFGSHNYSKEELVAELGSAFLCSEAGISPKVISNQAAYIQGWLKNLKSDKKLLVKAASDAQKASDYILNKGMNMLEKEAVA